MTAGATVIVVDGRASNRTIYARVAASLGEAIQVHTFCAAYAALHWLRSQPADLVITDSSMIGLDGSEFLRVLRMHAPNRNTPVVVLTVDRDTAVCKSMLGAGATAVVYTPISPLELRNMLCGLLRSRG